LGLGIYWRKDGKPVRRRATQMSADPPCVDSMRAQAPRVDWLRTQIHRAKCAKRGS
jgi:hypothetical protein